MSIDKKYLPNQENYFLQSGKQLLVFTQAGRKLMHVEIPKYKKLLLKEELFFETPRMYPQNPYLLCLAQEDWGQIDDAKGELGSTGNGN